jgi:hypothetical protein
MLLQGGLGRIVEQVGQPAGVVEQLRDRDFGCYDAQLRQMTADRVLERDPALLDQLEDGSGNEGLRHAADDERCVRCQLRPSSTVTPAAAGP